VGHACVTTGRRGFSMPTFIEGGSAPAPWKASILEWNSTYFFSQIKVRLIVYVSIII